MAERSNFCKEKRKKNKEDSELAPIDFSSSVEKDFVNKNMQIKKKRKIADPKMFEKGYTVKTGNQSRRKVADESEEKKDITLLEDEIVCSEDSTNVKAKIPEQVVTHSAEIDMECASTILETESISNKEEASETKEEILKSPSLEKVFSSKHSPEVRIEFPRVGVSPTPEVDMEDSMEAHESKKEYSEYVFQDKNFVSEDSTKVKAKLPELAVGPTSKVDLESQPGIHEMECKSNEEITMEAPVSDIKVKDDERHNKEDKPGNYLVTSDDNKSKRKTDVTTSF